MGENRQSERPKEQPGAGRTFDVEEHVAFLRWLRRKKTRLQKKRARFLHEYDVAQQWELWQQEAELLRAHLPDLKRGMREIILEDWWLPGKKRTILLDPAKTPIEEVESRFRRAKKAKNSLIHLSSLLQKMEREEHLLEDLLEKSEKVETHEAFQELMQSARFIKQTHISPSQHKTKTSLPYRTYLSASGLPIWVGKKARDNEILTFHYARGNDWWLHVADYPGSHVIIRSEKKREIDTETLQDAMLLALYYSRARGEKRAEITVTQCKYVTRLRGAKAGQVALSKHRTYSIQWDPTRWSRLQDGCDETSVH